MNKTILIIGVNSELAQDTIKELKRRKFKIYSTSRQVGVIDENVFEFCLDVTSEANFIHLKEKIKNLQFDVILNFAGIALAGPVEQINEIEFKKQLDVNLFGLHKIIKYLCPNLAQKGKLINVSSMASYGIFPFLSPYSISKAASDILLNTYSLESGVKTVSIRPGAVATKFWDSSIELNKKCFECADEKFNNIDKYKKEKKFLLENAKKNSLHALNPIYVAKKIADIVEKKNPHSVYNIGLDAKITKITRFLPLGFTNFLVKLILKKRVSKIN